MKKADVIIELVKLGYNDKDNQLDGLLADNLELILENTQAATSRAAKITELEDAAALAAEAFEDKQQELTNLQAAHAKKIGQIEVLETRIKDLEPAAEELAETIQVADDLQKKVKAYEEGKTPAQKVLTVKVNVGTKEDPKMNTLQITGDTRFEQKIWRREDLAEEENHGVLLRLLKKGSALVKNLDATEV